MLDLQSRSEARKLSHTLNGFILDCPVFKYKTRAVNVNSQLVSHRPGRIPLYIFSEID